MAFMIKLSYSDVKLNGKDDMPCEYVEPRKYANMIRPACRNACRSCSYKTKKLPKRCRDYEVNRSEENVLGLYPQGWDKTNRAWTEIAMPQDVE